jgi:RNA polymerase sigma factor (sigma-70 family)
MEHRREATKLIDLPSGSSAPVEYHAGASGVNSNSHSDMSGMNKISPLRRELAALAEGDGAAQMLHHIRFYLYKAGLGGDRELALELFHESVAAALASEQSYDANRSAKAWLLGIAAHMVQRRRALYFRQKKHETQASDLASAHQLDGEMDEEQLFDYLLTLGQAGPTHADPETSVLGRVAVDELLAPLSDEDRQVITYNLLYEMNGQEIAQVLETSPVAARVRFHRALKRLRACWPAHTPRPHALHEAQREETHLHE